MCVRPVSRNGIDERNPVRAALVGGGALYIGFASEGINLLTLKCSGLPT
uniref:Uncharacterized protein n=1 Tax=Ciceribacter selenitireducens ATCC BAA-1503 TaxID=1336235 RepID=A0A380TLK3_9HYPH|nr:unnamed protein product [Ciceribacter selenitireducens ATCC BAA-1503]